MKTTINLSRKSVPLCPTCGAPMREVKNKYGGVFWGCTMFPKCIGKRGHRDIEVDEEQEGFEDEIHEEAFRDAYFGGDDGLCSF